MHVFVIFKLAMKSSTQSGKDNLQKPQLTNRDCGNRLSIIIITQSSLIPANSCLIPANSSLIPANFCKSWQLQSDP